MIKFKNILTSVSMIFSIIILSAIIGLGIHLVFAWTGPGSNPSGGNVAAPITATGDQTINGSLTLSGNLTANGRYLNLGSQYLYGDNSSALYWNNNHDTVTQMIFRDAQGLQYGRVYGSGDGAYFGLLDGDGNWSYLAAKDSYTAFRINNVERMRITDTQISTAGQMRADWGFCIGSDCKDSWSAIGSNFVWKNAPSAIGFTCDSTWRNVDVTAQTSSNAKIVILSLKSGGGRWMYITTRRNGSTADREGYFGHEDDGAMSDGGMIIQGMDANQIFQYNCSVEGNPNPYVLGYIE